MPPHAAMLLHVTVSDAVRHALVAECIDQPIEDGWRIVTAHRGDDPLARQANSAVLYDAPSAGNETDTVNKPNRCSKVQRFCS